MSDITFKFYAVKGLDKIEIDADCVQLVCSNGQKFELSPRKSDGEVSLYSQGRMDILPQASNCVRLRDT